MEGCEALIALICVNKAKLYQFLPLSSMGKIHHKPIPGFPGQHTRGHKYYAQLKTQPATYMVKGCCISTAPDAGLDKVDIP